MTILGSTSSQREDRRNDEFWRDFASAATIGEVLLSAEGSAAADLDANLGLGSLALKGKRSTTEVVTLRIEPA